MADLDDTQGGTTQEGVHLGAMAGSVDILTRNFAGLQMRADRLIFEPHLPEPVNALQFQIRYRGQCVDVALNHHRLRLVTHECTTASGIQVGESRPTRWSPDEGLPSGLRHRVSGGG